MYRYEGGSAWVSCGCPSGSTQTYGAVTSEGRLYVGTWPEGEVHRYDGGETWTLLGRVGYEREIMGMALYNGKAYVGSLPMANVWRMDGEQFTFLGTLDTASAPLRRVLVHGRLPGQALRRHAALRTRLCHGSREDGDVGPCLPRRMAPCGCRS